MFLCKILEHIRQPMRMNIVEIIEELTFFKEMDNMSERYIGFPLFSELWVKFTDHLPFFNSKILEFIWFFALLYFLFFIEDVIIILENLVMIQKRWFHKRSPFLYYYLFSLLVLNYLILCFLSFLFDFFNILYSLVFIFFRDIGFFVF